MTGGVPPDGVVIDLGEGHGEVAAPSWSPRRALDTLRQAVARIGVVRTGWLAVVALLALAVGGAAVLPGAPLRQVLRMPLPGGAALLVDGDRLVVLDTESVVSVYALRDGSLVVRTRVGIPAGYRAMTASDGVVLIGGGAPEGDPAGTYALDEGTGRLLWTSPYDLYAPLPGTGTALLQSAAGTDLRLVDTRTGVPRWSQSTAGCRTVLDEPPGAAAAAHIALLCANGYLDMVALPGGSVQPVPGPPAGTLGPDIDAQFLAAGPMLVVERFGSAAEPTIAAYRWSDGMLAWTHPSLGDGDTLAACGGDVCVTGEGRGVALDPASGAEVNPPDLAGTGASLAGFDPGTLLVVPAGRTARAAPGTYPVPVQPAGTGLVLRMPARLPVASTGVVAAAAPNSTPEVPVLVEIVAADGSVRPLERVAGITPLSCAATGAYLICPTGPGTATVWRLPA